MSKKLLIIIGAAGLISFVGTFIFALLKTSTDSPSGEDVQSTLTDGMKLLQPETASIKAAAGLESGMKKTITEKQLEGLVDEVREKMQDYNAKLQNLEVRKQRLQIAGDALKKDIEELDSLRIELASVVASLKNEQDKLEKMKLEIESIEKDNLISIAATYDKMDPKIASDILASMNKAQDDSANDAVKILYYMSARARAKVLAATKPATSAYFCKKLKQIIERE